jgi:hypothetical protein
MFTKIRSLFAKRLALTLAGVGLAGVVAAATVYIGFNPSTGLSMFTGTNLAVGTLPVLSSTTTSCGTYATVSASMLGGASTWQVTANTTTCTLKFTFPSAAPNGYFCVASDETTPADTMKQSAHDTLSCTLTGTVVSADNIIIEVNGF